MKLLFDKSRKAEISVKEHELTISGIQFTAEHDQYCCEEVYADFEQAAPYKQQVEELGEVTKIEVENVADEGFTIFVYNGEKRLGVFIGCYNEQNGYYSSNLLLVATEGNVKTTMELSVEDKID